MITTSGVIYGKTRRQKQTGNKFWIGKTMPSEPSIHHSIDLVLHRLTSARPSNTGPYPPSARRAFPSIRSALPSIRSARRWEHTLRRRQRWRRRLGFAPTGRSRRHRPPPPPPPRPRRSRLSHLTLAIISSIPPTSSIPTQPRISTTGCAKTRRRITIQRLRFNNNNNNNRNNTRRTKNKRGKSKAVKHVSQNPGGNLISSTIYAKQ